MGWGRGSCKSNRLEVIMFLLFHGTSALYIFQVYFPQPTAGWDLRVVNQVENIIWEVLMCCFCVGLFFLCGCLGIFVFFFFAKVYFSWGLNNTLGTFTVYFILKVGPKEIDFTKSFEIQSTIKLVELSFPCLAG